MGRSQGVAKKISARRAFLVGLRWARRALLLHEAQNAISRLNAMPTGMACCTKMHIETLELIKTLSTMIVGSHDPRVTSQTLDTRVTIFLRDTPRK
jgi:hypothetical protein